MLHIQGSSSEVGKMSPIILSLMSWKGSALLRMGQVRRGGGEIGRHREGEAVRRRQAQEVSRRQLRGIVCHGFGLL